MKYTFKLTEHEMRIIRLALDLEAIRKAKADLPSADEVKKLADYFERRIRDAQGGDN